MNSKFHRRTRWVSAASFFIPILLYTSGCGNWHSSSEAPVITEVDAAHQLDGAPELPQKVRSGFWKHTEESIKGGNFFVCAGPFFYDDDPSIIAYYKITVEKPVPVGRQVLFEKQIAKVPFDCLSKHVSEVYELDFDRGMLQFFVGATKFTYPLREGDRWGRSRITD